MELVFVDSLEAAEFFEGVGGAVRAVGGFILGGEGLPFDRVNKAFCIEFLLQLDRPGGEAVFVRRLRPSLLLPLSRSLKIS